MRWQSIGPARIYLWYLTLKMTYLHIASLRTGSELTNLELSLAFTSHKHPCDSSSVVVYRVIV